MPLSLASEAFQNGEAIPARYSCDGEDLSPALAWRDAPSGVASYALIFDDPDAPMGTWVHWVLFNIPASVTALPEGYPDRPEAADGTRNGTNNWGRLGYGGPCPPGGTHRYFFRLYALDGPLDLPPGASKQEVLDAMKGHILDQAELMGTYTR